jgi:hypothetical protein
VKTRVDALLRAQAAAFAFRFACEDCAHFDAPGERCSLGYPAAPRRRALALRDPPDRTEMAPPGDERAAPDVVLCKTFELG